MILPNDPSNSLRSATFKRLKKGLEKVKIWKIKDEIYERALSFFKKILTSLNNDVDVISSCNNFKMNEDREDQGEDENRSRRFVKADDPALAEDDDELLRSGLSHVLLKEV
jgi:hypothetical protein